MLRRAGRYDGVRKVALPTPTSAPTPPSAVGRAPRRASAPPLRSHRCARYGRRRPWDLPPWQCAHRCGRCRRRVEVSRHLVCLPVECLLPTRGSSALFPDPRFNGAAKVVLPKTPTTDALWQTFARHSGLGSADYQVVSFGDSPPEMATELAALVVAGTKRATASLKRDYADGRLPLPKVGDFVVVVDGVARHAASGAQRRSKSNP